LTALAMAVAVADPVLVLPLPLLVPAGILIIFHLFVLVIATVAIVWGALLMMRLESYRWAIVASILAMVVPPGFLIGLPVGVWSIWILSRRNVREAFAVSDRVGDKGDLGAAKPFATSADANRESRSGGAVPSRASPLQRRLRRAFLYILPGFILAVLLGPRVFDVSTHNAIIQITVEGQPGDARADEEVQKIVRIFTSWAAEKGGFRPIEHGKDPVRLFFVDGDLGINLVESAPSDRRGPREAHLTVDGPPFRFPFPEGPWRRHVRVYLTEDYGRQPTRELRRLHESLLERIRSDYGDGVQLSIGYSGNYRKERMIKLKEETSR
jgi:hypothetical protein